MALDRDPNHVFRDFVTAGLPSSGNWNPRKPEIRQLLAEWWQTLIALVADAGGLELPNLLISMTVTGGDENNIVADANLPVPAGPGVAVFSIVIEEANTGPVTINGKPLLSNTGNPLIAGALSADGIYLFLDNGESYRLLSDYANSALVEAAEAAAERAEEARDEAVAAAGANLSSVDSRAAALSINFPAPVNYIRTAGYAAAGDGGGALYKRVATEPSHAGKLQTADGSWWELVDVAPTAISFGAVADGVTPASASIQELLDFKRSGRVVIPEGEYYLDEDIIIRTKRIAMESAQVFEVDATGARFYGPGRIVINGSKRVSLNGFYAPETDLVLNGCWWGNFIGLQFRDLILCESAGDVFTSNYWNTFTNCLFQVAKTSTGAAAGSNAFTFIESSMRGSASQGFAAARDYAFEFAGDHLAQAWTFIGGDVSYYNIDIYTVPPSNPTREVSVHFEGTYFDQKLPAPSTRPGVRVTTNKCVTAVATSYSAPLVGGMLAPQDLYVQSRLFHLTGKGGVNLIPNGDFREQHNVTYTGVGRPLVGTSGSTVTRHSGGPTGHYLNINQPTTSSNQVSFRARSTVQGYYSTLLAMRNAGSGEKEVRLNVFNDHFFPVTLKSTEWTLVPFTVASTLKAADINLDLGIYTNDGTGFNVDVAYAGIFLGIGGDFASEPVRPERIYHSFTHNPPSIAAGDAHVYAHTMLGAEVGDFVQVSASETLQGIIVSPYINAANTIALNFFNPTGATVDLGSMTFRVIVEKSPY